MNNHKVLMLVRTSGLEYDDRVRKEALSLKALGCEVFILANYVSNASEKGVTSYGVPYKVIRLHSRSLLGPARLLAVKMLEFWLVSTWHLLRGRYNILWAHEEYTILSLLLKFPKVWYVFDQHELPEFLVASDFRKRIYKRVERVSDVSLVANKRRLDYMKSLGLIRQPEKYFVVNNYPDQVFAQKEVRDMPAKLKSWLGDSEYILMQGGGHSSRYPMEVISSIALHNQHKIVLVGPVEASVEEGIKEQFDDLVFRTGYVNQLELTDYIDHARYSIILYATYDPNNLLCEPNRLYQAVCRGIPVIVGMNPPMKDLVEQNNIGVVLEDDGKNADGIYEAILKMEDRLEEFQQNVSEVKHVLNWESQISIIEKALPKK